MGGCIDGANYDSGYGHASGVHYRPNYGLGIQPYQGSFSQKGSGSHYHPKHYSADHHSRHHVQHSRHNVNYTNRLQNPRRR